jgi:hypothetical protein
VLPITYKMLLTFSNTQRSCCESMMNGTAANSQFQLLLLIQYLQPSL